MRKSVKGQPAAGPVLSGASSSLVRRVNEVAVLNALRAEGSLTAPDLASRLAISRPTVDAVLASLIREGWVSERLGEARPRHQGRPARTYDFRADARFVAGLDLTPSGVRAQVADLYGEPRGDAVAPVPRGNTVTAYLQAAHSALDAAADQAGVPPAAIAVVVAGTPGIVSTDGTRVISGDPSHAGLLAAGLPGDLAAVKLLGNDVNLAAVAETWHRADGGATDLLFVLVGDRLGTGLVLDGRSRTGVHGAAGEIGTLKFLGWEQAHDALRAYARATGRSVGDAVAALAANDEERILENLTDALARGIAASSLTVDPQLIVLAGPDGIPELLTAALRQRLQRLTDVRLELSTSILGEERVCTGAIRTALTQLDQLIFQPGEVELPMPIVLA